MAWTLVVRSIIIGMLLDRLTLHRLRAEARLSCAPRSKQNSSPLHTDRGHGSAIVVLEQYEGDSINWPFRVAIETDHWNPLNRRDDTGTTSDKADATFQHFIDIYHCEDRAEGRLCSHIH